MEEVPEGDAFYYWPFPKTVRPITRLLRSRVTLGHGTDEVGRTSAGAAGGAGDVGLAVDTVTPDRGVTQRVNTAPLRERGQAMNAGVDTAEAATAQRDRPARSCAG